MLVHGFECSAHAYRKFIHSLIEICTYTILYVCALRSASSTSIKYKVYTLCHMNININSRLICALHRLRSRCLLYCSLCLFSIVRLCFSHYIADTLVKDKQKMQHNITLRCAHQNGIGAHAQANDIVISFFLCCQIGIQCIPIHEMIDIRSPYWL